MIQDAIPHGWNIDPIKSSQNLGTLSEYAKRAKVQQKSKILKSLSYISDTIIWSKKTSHAAVPLKEEEEERRSLTATDVFHSISFCQSHPKCFNFTKGEFKLKTGREGGRRGNRSARWGGGGRGVGRNRAYIQWRGSILAWIVILSVYGADTIAEVKLWISPSLRWSLDLWNQLLGF